MGLCPEPAATSRFLGSETGVQRRGPGQGHDGDGRLKRARAELALARSEGAPAASGRLLNSRHGSLEKRRHLPIKVTFCDLQR